MYPGTASEGLIKLNATPGDPASPFMINESCGGLGCAADRGVLHVQMQNNPQNVMHINARGVSAP